MTAPGGTSNPSQRRSMVFSKELDETAECKNLNLVSTSPNLQLVNESQDALIEGKDANGKRTSTCLAG